jgi:hypothetical protein
VLPEDSPLNERLSSYLEAAAAGAALSASGVALSRWCADERLGWSLAILSALLGSQLARRFNPVATSEESHGWLAAGGIGVAAGPALLRFLGLALADPAFLQDPLVPGGKAWFILCQAAMLCVVTSAALTRSNLIGQNHGGLAFAVAAIVAAASASRCEPTVLAAAAGLTMFASAVRRAKPWAQRTTKPLRLRLYLAASFFCAVFAVDSPKVLPDVWLARLHSAYPGGGFLMNADDGRHSWSAYRFSNGFALLLKDGVTQAPDPASTRAAIRVVLAQKAAASSLLFLHLGEVTPVRAALDDGASSVNVIEDSPAQARALDALSAGAWRTTLAPQTRADAVLVFVSRPASGGFRAFSPAAEIARLTGRLSPSPTVAFLFPEGSSQRAIISALKAASAYGVVRRADLPRGVLIVAGPVDPLISETVLLQRFPLGPAELAASVHWRDSPSGK